MDPTNSPKPPSPLLAVWNALNHLGKLHLKDSEKLAKLSGDVARLQAEVAELRAANLSGAVAELRAVAIELRGQAVRGPT